MALALVTGRARAEDAASDPPWAVVTVLVRGQDEAAEGRRVRALLEAAAVPVEAEGPIGALVEERDSADATPLAASDVERWASRSRAALRFLSRGDYAQARQALLEAQAISERAAEALNRETLRARQVLDTCLFVVRASLETDDLAGAEEQTRRCRRLVPRMQASTYTHTPEVRELVARIDAELERESAGVLAVSSDPAGCDVRINGVFFGTSPLTTSELPRGEYRVQVECDESFAGRMHRVRVGERDVALSVRSVFDRALRIRPTLALVYGDADSARANALADAATLARRLGRRVLAVEPSADRITLVGIDARGRRSRPVLLDAPFDAADADPRLSSFRTARTRSAGAASTRSPTTPERRHRRIGAGLVAGGGSALALAVGLQLLRVHRGARLDATSASMPGYLDRQSDYLRLRPVVLATALVGGLVTTGGSAVLVRSAERPRAYAFVGGAVGLGLAALAALEVSRAPVCYGGAICTERDVHLDRAILFAAAAGPALSLPIAVATVDSDRPLRASVAVAPHVASLTLRGALR